MTDTDEAVSLATEVREWLATNWHLDLPLRRWWERLFDAGYAFPTWPSGLGGRGLRPDQARVISAELAAAGVIGPPSGQLAVGLAAPTILAHGTPEQINHYIPRIAKGDDAWCQLFSEPGAGSDLASLGARAERDGDEWVVSGQKVWNSGADQSQMGMLLARTDRDAPKHRGITYFLIDMDQPGVEVRPLIQMNGESRFCEVFLTEARVRHDDILGSLNDGWAVAQTTLAAERSNTAGRGATGLVPARSGAKAGDLDRPVGELIEAARRSRTSRIPSGAIPARMMIELARDAGRTDCPLIRQELARYFAQTRVNSWTLRRSAAAKGRLTGADGSMAKLATARICQQSRDLSFSIMGAEGLLSGDDAPLQGDVHRVGLASPGNRIGGGTDEIQLNVLGERGLGLPREPSVDKDVPYRQLQVGTLSD